MEKMIKIILILPILGTKMKIRDSETYQVQGSGTGFGCRRVVSLYLQHEDAVTSGGPLIGQSLGPGTVLSRLLDNDFDLVLVGDFLHLEVCDVDVGSFSVAHLYLVLQVGVRL